MLLSQYFTLMTGHRKIKPGEARWVSLANGTTICGFHVQLERRWEILEFKLTPGIGQGYYSRTTGKIANDTKASSILVIDPGFYYSQLKEIL